MMNAHGAGQQIARDTGSYPGMIHDISECNTLGEVFEAQPVLNQGVERVPLYTVDGDVIEKLPSSHVMRNSETGVPYSVVSESYGIMQHSSALELCEDFRSQGARYSQAGIMAAGGTVWVSMTLDNVSIEQHGGEVDEMLPSLLVLSDHTTAHAQTVTKSLRRISCNNQLPYIKNDSGRISFRHRANVDERFTICRDLFSTLGADISQTLDGFYRLARLPMSDKQFSRWSDGILTMHRGASVLQIGEGEYENHPRRQTDIDELSEFFATGNQGAGETLWGGFQSLTAWLDHKAERMEESKQTRKRIESLWKSNTLGTGARLKDRALRTLVESR